MNRLETTYMGLKLPSPLIASASPLNRDIENLRKLEDTGAGAVVLPSLFAEQVEAEDRRTERLMLQGALSSPEAASYFPNESLYNGGPDPYLETISRAKAAINIPVIASLNADHEDAWVAFATQIEDAGADALELNIYSVPSDIRLSGREVEERVLDTVRSVRMRLSIPLAVKLSPYFSSTGHMASDVVKAGADGLVLFNRFYQPDIDIAHLQVLNSLDLSQSSEMRLPLLWLAILCGRTSASLAATTGVHTVDDVVKYLLAGADVVMTTSALLQKGIGHMHTLNSGLEEWLEARDMDSVSRIRGLLSQNKLASPKDYERANYIKILEGYEAEP